MAKGPTLTVTLLTDDKMTPGLRGATTSVEGFGKKISGFAVGASAAITSMAVSAVPKLVGLAGDMVGLGQTAELYATKSKTVFGSNAGDIAKWADTVNESLGLSDEAVVGLAASMGDLLVPMGFTRDEAAKMTKDTLGVAGALSAWSGGTYDTAAVSDILTKAMLGEREQLKALGISINQAEVDQRAMTIAAKDGRDAITAQDKALATQQLIFEKSADAQAAWTDGSMDAIKKQNEMKASIEDVKTSIGTALLPIIQTATKWIVESFIPGVRNLVETFKERWPEIRAAIEPTLLWIQQTVSDVVEFVQLLWEQFGERILTHAQNTWEYIRAAIESALTIIKGVIDLITGLMKGDWEQVWEAIKSIVDGVWSGIVNLIRFALQTIGTIIDIAWENVKGLFRSTWDGLARYIDETWEKIKSGVSSGINAIVGFVAGLPGRIVTAVGDGFESLWESFKKYANLIVDGWNALEFTLPSVDTRIPGIGKIGGWTLGTPDIPRFHQGGVVPGAMGAEVPAILQAGEVVFTQQQMSAMGRSGGGISLTVNAGMGADGNRIGSEIVRYLKEWEHHNGPGWRS